MSEEGRTQRTSAGVHRSSWPGWIWAIPIAALLVVAWLLFRHLSQGGTDITIAFPDAHGLKDKDAGIEYRGLKIGSTTGITLSKDGKEVIVAATIDSSASKYLTTGTIFWLNGAKPSISDLSSLGALLSGPTIMMQPEPGAKTRSFHGLEQAPLVAGPHGPPVLYVVAFSGAVGSLSPGDKVTLRGLTVGDIGQIGFRYDAQNASVSTPVTLALYPEGFHLHGQANLRTAITKLVGAGLRARMEQNPPLIGKYQVTLEMVAGAPPAAPAKAGGMPEIPVAPGGGLNALLSRFNKVPVGQIAQNVLHITHRVDALVASPKLSDSITQLDATLKQVHQTAANVGPQVAQLAQQLRATADQIDQVAHTANKTLGGAPSQNGINSTLQEVTEAARSIRELANYLDSHPDALIKGRSGG